MNLFLSELMKSKIFFAIIIFGIISCRHKSDDGRKFFRYNQAAGIKSLDPKDATTQSTIWACNQLYNGLVQFDSSLKINPSIARSWEISSDGLTYTFHLRSDVFFHDNENFTGKKGRRVVASDFVFSFSRIENPSIAPDACWVFADKVDSLNPFEAHDDSTFIMHMKKVFPPMLGTLTTQICSVVPKEIVEAEGNDFGIHPCGTGPFKFKAWREGEVMILEKNSTYFERDENGIQLPYIDGIRISFIDSKTSEFLSFRQQQLDLITDIDASVKDEVLTKDGELQPAFADLMRIQKCVNLCTEYIGFNLYANGNEVNDAVKEKEFREAFSYGIDKEKLITYLRNGIGKAGNHGFVSYGLHFYNTDSVGGFSYNPSKAKELLKNLKDVSATIYCSTQNEAICSFVANELNQLGMKINVEAMQNKTLRQQEMNNQVSCFRASWIADYADAESFLSCFYSHYGAGPNYTRYKNAAFDKLYDEAASELNDSLRNIIYMRMDSLMMKDAPVVPLYYDEVVRFVQPTVSGLSNNPLNLLDLRRVKIK